MSPLHSIICVLFTVLSSLTHNSHGRMPHARCVVNSVGDTEDGRRLSCVYGRTIRWEMGLYEDGVCAYLGEQSHCVRVLGAGSGVLLCVSPLIHSRRL